MEVGAPTRFFRQASEQYFTASQSLRHFLRQANGRPQAAQILVGRSVLLFRPVATGPLAPQPLRNGLCSASSPLIISTSRPLAIEIIGDRIAQAGNARCDGRSGW